MKKLNLLKGKAEFKSSRNDLFWSFCILDSEKIEFFHGTIYGYNDAYWWDNVSEKASVVKVKGDKGTEKTFKVNYRTLEVVEVGEE